MSAWEDVDNDGDLDLILHFRLEDTNLLDLYEELLREDLLDGTLDSHRQLVDSVLEGMTNDDLSFEGLDTLELFLTGKHLKDFRRDRAI